MMEEVSLKPINEDGNAVGSKWPVFGDRVRVKRHGKWLKGIVVKSCAREDRIEDNRGSYGVYVYLKKNLTGKRVRYADYEYPWRAPDEDWAGHVTWVGRASNSLKLGW